MSLRAVLLQQRIDKLEHRLDKLYEELEAEQREVADEKVRRNKRGELHAV